MRVSKGIATTLSVRNPSAVTVIRVGHATPRRGIYNLLAKRPQGNDTRVFGAYV